VGRTDGHELIKELGSSCACADSLPHARLYPETEEAVERWHQGKINIFDEMARLERERDEAERENEQLLASNKTYERDWPVLVHERNKALRCLELIAEDCEAWLQNQCDETCCEMVKLVAKFAREALQ